MRPVLPLMLLLAACPSDPVDPPGQLTGLEVEPASLQLPAGQSVDLRAWALLDDGTREDRTDEVEWLVSSEQFATLDPDEPGRVHGILPGSTAVSAALDVYAAASVIEVVEADVVDVLVTPLSVELPVGLQRAMTATGVLSDGGALDLTELVVWSSSVPDVAEFDAERPGVLLARAPGLSTVSATYEDRTGAAEVEVDDRELLELSFDRPAFDVAEGLQVTLGVSGHWSDGAVEDVTAQAAWSSSNPEVATVQGGTVTGVDAGTSLIEATLFGVDVEVLATVGAAVSVGLEVRPDTLDVVLGTQGALEAFALMSDGSEVDVTAEALWSSDAPDVASAGNDVGREGVITTVSEGGAIVSATHGDWEAASAVTVSAPELLLLTVDPPSGVLAVGESQAYTVEGVWSDGTREDLTGSADWSVSPLGLAQVTPSGTVSALYPGPVTVTATVGALGGSATLTVEEAALVSIAVTPVGLRMPVGTEQAMVATGTWTDGTVSDVTADGFWGSSAPGFASITNLPGSEGLVNAVAPGPATMLITVDSVSGSVALEVVPPEAIALEIAAVDPLTVGDVVALVCEAEWSDGSVSEVTADAAWSSDTPAVLSTSNDAGLEGQATAQGAGSAEVTCSFAGLDAVRTIDVADP